MDWFGFDEFENIKTERFLKYDEMVIMTNLIEKDIYKTGEKFCDTTFKLSENVRTQRRVYTKFVTILGDIGGFMEVLFTLFRIISSFSVDILYEISMVNRLFKFDLDKKNVILKEDIVEKAKTIASLKSNENYEEMEKNNIEEKNKKSNNDIAVANIRKTVKRRSTKVTTYKRKTSSNDLMNSNFTNSKTKSCYQKIEIANKKGDNKGNNKNCNNEEKIINKVRLNRACIYLWFNFARKSLNINNALINEGMYLISRRLDIFNLFEQMYKDEQRNEPLLNKTFCMSDECKRGIKLVQIYN